VASNAETPSMKHPQTREHVMDTIDTRHPGDLQICIKDRERAGFELIIVLDRGPTAWLFWKRPFNGTQPAFGE